MIEIEIRKEDEFIKLGQALKKAGLVESGAGCKVRDPGWTCNCERGSRDAERKEAARR